MDTKAQAIEPEVVTNDIFRNSHLAKLLADAISQMNSGTLIPYIALLNMTGKSTKGTLAPVLQAAREILKAEHGLFLENVRRVGYKIVAPGEEIAIVSGKFERGKRTIRQAVIDGNRIRLERLGEDAKTNTLQTMQRMANMYSLLAAA